MSRANKALAMLVVVSLGLWGCAQGTGGPANAERIRTLEAKIAKLEDDFRAAVNVREQLNKKLKAAEKHVEELQVVVKERDDLRQQLGTRTAERDTLQAQFDVFRKGLKDLLGKADAAAAALSASQPVTSASLPAVVGKL
jgi:septal ring factor EnvC (AmiA/AmiB activator)